MPMTELSLYRVEEAYLAFLDSEGLVQPDQELEFREELEQALLYRDEKREAVGQFMLYLGSQLEACDREITRLQRRKETIVNVERRMSQYIKAVIKMVPPDKRGMYRHLDSATVKMYLRALPSSVDITDESQISSQYKRVKVSMPLDLWQRLQNAQPELQMYTTLGINVGQITVDKELVREAIESGREVPGADMKLSGHDHTLIVK